MPKNDKPAEPVVAVETAEDAAREARMEIIDPVTNQRAGDFFPGDDGLDERSQHLILDNLSAAGVSARVTALSGARIAREQQAEGIERAKEVLAQVENDNPIPDDALDSMALDPATYRARMYARVQAQAMTLGTSTTIPGGRYIVNGKAVNAAGDLIDDDGNVLSKRS